MDSAKPSQSDPPPASTPGKICPYLGRYNDPATCYGYPDRNNCCHHADPPQHVLLDYQTNVCLAGAGANQACPVYPEGWNGPFPPQIRGVVQASSRPWGLWLGSLFAILVLLILSYVFFFSQSASSTPIGQTPTPVAVLILDSTSTSQAQTAAATLTSTPIPPTPSPTAALPTHTATQTNPPPPTARPTAGQPTPGPLEETPFGPDGHYLVHIVKEGDTLESLAKLYDTTGEVLKAINMAPPQTGLWVGVPTIVIIGEKDPSKVTPLKAVWLAERTQVLELRQKYNMTTADFLTINGLGAGAWVEAGRWLIVYR
jgi:hypothetical protein